MRNDDEMLRLYLLGDLPQEESHRLEERLLAEDDLGELSEAIETEVLEAWSRGELSAAQRERIELVLAHSPRLRSRAALLRDFARIGARTSNQNGTGRIVPFPPRIDLSRPAVRFASLAAGLLLMTGATWLALSLAPNAAEMEMAAGAALDRLVTPPTAPPATGRPPAPPSPAPRLQPAGPGVARVPETPAAPRQAPAVTAVFQLATQVLRGDGSEGGDGGEGAEGEIPVLTVPAGTEQIEIQLLLGDGYGGYASYTAVLRGERDREILSAAGLKARETGGGAAVVLPVPRRKLPEGRYLIELSGVSEAGEPQRIGYPEFEVRR